MLLADGAWSARASAASAASNSVQAAPQEAALRAVATEIRAQAKGRIKTFYEARGFAPLWASAGHIGPEADALMAFLASADLDGLKPSRSKIEKLRAAVLEAQMQDPRALARAELALSDTFSRYAMDLRRPTKFSKSYLKGDLKPKKLKADAVLRAAALAPSFSSYISSMAWMSPHYAQLRKLLRDAQARGNSDDVLQRLQLNLARAQALPGPWTHHVVVDSAAGRLWYYQAGKQKGTMRVVVGKPDSQTPMLAGMLHYAILNPYWNVPVDLAQKNIAPKILAGKSLTDMGFEALADWSAAAPTLDPAAINWSAVASGAQEIRLRQLPGSSNAMGRVKFMFPNELGIYLHDTPERELLRKADRHVSNGCIRLEDADALGKWLLGRSIRSASKTPEQIVPLPLPVPVYLTYFSAFESDNGADFHDDIYERDQPL